MNAWLEQHAPDDLDVSIPTRPHAYWLADAPNARPNDQPTEWHIQRAAEAPQPCRTCLLQLHEACTRLGRQDFGPFDLALRPGERVAILGPSGAGKSTLLKMMAGDLPAAQGRVDIEGRALAQWQRAPLSARRAVLPQAHAVAFGLPVELVVALGRVAREPDPQQAEIADRALCAASAGHLRGRRFDTLSGGEQARVQIARVFAQLWDGRGGLLLVDEPLAALDPGLQFELMHALQSFAAERGHALVAVLHDINQALAGFERLWLVSEGRLLADLPADRDALPALECLYGIGLTPVDAGDGSFSVLMRRRASSFSRTVLPHPT